MLCSILSKGQYWIILYYIRSTSTANPPSRCHQRGRIPTVARLWGSVFAAPIESSHLVDLVFRGSSPIFTPWGLGVLGAY